MSDLTPGDVLSDLPTPDREQTRKTLYDRRPGHINLASDRANFAGCRYITFSEWGPSGLEEADAKQFAAEVDALSNDREYTREDYINLYFSHRANLLVLEMHTIDDEVGMLITNQLDDEDMEEFQEVQQRVNLEMREWREKRAERAKADEELARENKRLIEVGKRAETYNWAERLRKLEALADKAGLRKLGGDPNDAY